MPLKLAGDWVAPLAPELALYPGRALSDVAMEFLIWALRV